MKSLLKVEKLSKKFGKRQILKDVNIELFSGDILAFIGPNGSGKTTTIKMILGLQSIDSGSITINGYNVKSDFAKAIFKVGAIVESPDSYMYLTGYQNLKLLANLYPNCDDNKIIELLKLVDLYDRKDDKVSKYSLGMRQRLGIAKSLINEPNILILDEPTNGLDPEGIKDMRELLVRLAKSGLGILISSHNLSELESFCNKVCILKKGHSEKIEEIKSIKNSANKYLIIVDNAKDLDEPGISELKSNSFIFEGSKEEVASLINKLVKLKKSIYEVKPLELSLEEAFLKKTGGNK